MSAAEELENIVGDGGQNLPAVDVLKVDIEPNQTKIDDPVKIELTFKADKRIDFPKWRVDVSQCNNFNACPHWVALAVHCGLHQQASRCL